MTGGNRLPIVGIAGLIVLAAVVTGHIPLWWLWVAVGLMFWPVVVIAAFLVGACVVVAVCAVAILVMDYVEAEKRRRAEQVRLRRRMVP